MTESSASSEIEAIRAGLRGCLDGASDFVELRYHAKLSRSVAVEQGRVDSAALRRRAGTGVRVLADGTFGFASCGSAEPGEVRAAIDRARAAAKASAAHRRERIRGLAPVALARGHFAVD